MARLDRRGLPLSTSAALTLAAMVRAIHPIDEKKGV